MIFKKTRRKLSQKSSNFSAQPRAVLGRAQIVFGRARIVSCRATPYPAILWRRHYTAQTFFSCSSTLQRSGTNRRSTTIWNILEQELTQQWQRRMKGELRLNRHDLLDQSVSAVFDGEIREEDENWFAIYVINFCVFALVKRVKMTIKMFLKWRFNVLEGTLTINDWRMANPSWAWTFGWETSRWKKPRTVV